MKLAPILFFCSLPFGLIGCGGSSTPAEITPEEPPVYIFSLTPLLKNKCGVASPFTDIELFVQDENWQVLSQHSPDESGEISFTTLDERINYTIAAKSHHQGEEQGYELTSFIGVKSNSTTTYYATSVEDVDNSTCECITGNIDVYHRPLTIISSRNSSAVFDEAFEDELDNRHTFFNGVEICRQVGEAWPVHSFMISGKDASNQKASVAGFFDAEIDRNDVEDINWQIAAIEGSNPIDLIGTTQGFSTYQQIGEQKHFFKEVPAEAEQTLVYEHHSYSSEVLYVANATHFIDGDGSILGEIEISSHHQIISTQYDEAYSVMAETEKPAIDDKYFSNLQPDGSYDYSDVTGYPFIAMTFNYRAFSPVTKLPLPLRWKIFGPNLGLLPITSALPGYEGVLSSMDLQVTETVLVNSAKTSDYDGYMSYFQNEDTAEFENNLKRYVIKIIDK